MSFYTKGGPTTDSNANLSVFDFNDIKDYHSNFRRGIPMRWDFKPFVFGKNEFKNK